MFKKIDRLFFVLKIFNHVHLHCRFSKITRVRASELLEKNNFLVSISIKNGFALKASSYICILSKKQTNRFNVETLPFNYSTNVSSELSYIFKHDLKFKTKSYL